MSKMSYGKLRLVPSTSKPKPLQQKKLEQDSTWDNDIIFMTMQHKRPKKKNHNSIHKKYLQQMTDSKKRKVSGSKTKMSYKSMMNQENQPKIYSTLT